MRNSEWNHSAPEDRAAETRLVGSKHTRPYLKSGLLSVLSAFAVKIFILQSAFHIPH